MSEPVDLCAVGGCGNAALPGERLVTAWDGHELEVPLCADHPDLQPHDVPYEAMPDVHREPPECGICGDYTAWGIEVHDVCLKSELKSLDVTRRILGILWNSTGYRSENLVVRDLFDPNDDIVIEVERLAIMPEWATVE